MDFAPQFGSLLSPTDSSFFCDPRPFLYLDVANGFLNRSQTFSYSISAINHIINTELSLFINFAHQFMQTKFQKSQQTPPLYLQRRARTKNGDVLLTALSQKVARRVTVNGASGRRTSHNPRQNKLTHISLMTDDECQHNIFYVFILVCDVFVDSKICVFLSRVSLYLLLLHNKRETFTR